jgi:hypothetical protein
VSSRRVTGRVGYNGGTSGPGCCALKPEMAPSRGPGSGRFRWAWWLIKRRGSGRDGARHSGQMTPSGTTKETKRDRSESVTTAGAWKTN